MAALNDQFGWDRQRISPVLCVVAFTLGIVFCCQAGLFWLDLVDHFITTYALVLIAICEALIVGWLFPVRRLREHLDRYKGFRSSRLFGGLMRLLITAMLMLTWIGLSQLHEAAIASMIGRFLLLASVVVLWVDEHWLDFNIRLLVPALLIFLLDQALVEEIARPYGDYPIPAIIGA